MKTVVLFSALLVFLAGCKKEEVIPAPIVVGKWDLTQTYSVTKTINTYRPNSGNVLSLDGSHFFEYRDGDLVNSGTYEILTTTGDENTWSTYKAVFTSSRDCSTPYLHLKNNELELIYTGAEAYQEWYKKIE